jgi:hypothetical protein
MRKRRGAKLLAGAALAAAAMVAWPAAAEGARSGTCFTFFVHQADYRGDLRTARTLWHFEKSFAVPRLKPGYALGVGIGFKMNKGSWDVAYLRSGHTAALENGEPAGVAMHLVEISGRSYLLRRFPIHPYFLGGIAVPILRVSRGAEFRGQSHSATYVGGGLTVGAGLAVDIGPSVVLTAGASGRFLRFLYAYGGGKGRDINNLTVGFGGPQFGRLLEASSWALTLGLGFIL